MLRIPVLRTPVLRIPVLRTPLLKIPALKFPVPGIIGVLLTLVLSVCVSLPSAWPAQETGQVLALSSTPQQYALSDYIYYFRDPGGARDISDILDPGTEFKKLNAPNISMGVMDGALWLRFRISDRSQASGRQSIRWLLDMGRPLEQEMQLYYPDGQGDWHVVRSCTDQPCDSGSYFRMGLFDLPDLKTGLGKTDRTYYLRIVAPTSMFFFPHVLSEKNFRKKDNISILFQGLYFGFALAMIIYSLSNLIFQKDPAYLWYLLFMLFMSLYFSVAYGLAIRFISFADVSTLIRFDLISLTLTAILACQFTRSFLKTKTNLPKGDLAIITYMFLSVITGVLVLFLGIRTSLQLYQVMGALWPVVTITPSVVILRRGFRPAQFVLVGWFVFSASVFLYSMSYNAHIQQSPWLFHSILIGSTIQIICFALALGHRFAVLGKEKDALDKSRRYYQKASLSDQLTGVLNRRGYDESLNRLILSAHKKQLSLCLMMIDVDHFKKFNDTYGHDNGDIVLQGLGRLMLGMARKSDIPCRYGGEEFALILPDTDSTQAFAIAERLRKAFNNIRFDEIGNGDIENSISIGVAQFRPSDHPVSLFKRADAALYQAKAQGRNRTILGT